MSSLRALLGLYRMFVDFSSTLALPPNRLLKKAAHCVGGEEQEKAFLHVKEELCDATILRLPDHYKTYMLTTN